MRKSVLCIVAVLVAVLLGGCASVNDGKKITWFPKDRYVAPEESKADIFVCSQESRTSWGGGGTGLIGAAMIIGSATAAHNTAQNIFFRCMEAKGYIWEDKETADAKIARLSRLSKENPAIIGLSSSLADTALPKILRVVPDSPSDKSGFHVGDMVKEINGTSITSSIQLLEVVNTQKKVGEPMTFVIERDNIERTIVVVPESKKPQAK